MKSRRQLELCGIKPRFPNYLRTLSATPPSIPVYMPPAVPNNFFKLPVADPKLAPICFFSYVRSSSALITLTPPETWAVVYTDGMLNAGRATNSYGVPARLVRLSSLEVLAVGVCVRLGVARVETVLRVVKGRRLGTRESLKRWNWLRYEDASLLGRWTSLGFHSQDFVGDFPSVTAASAGFHSVGSRSDLALWSSGGIEPSGRVRGVGFKGVT